MSGKEEVVKRYIAKAVVKRLPLRSWLRGFLAVRGDPELSQLAKVLVAKAERRMRDEAHRHGYAVPGARRLR